MRKIKLIPIILVMVSAVYSETDLLTEIIDKSVLELNGIRDTLFEKHIKHIVNDYALIEINYCNDANVRDKNRFVSKKEVIQYRFSNSFVDSIKTGIDSVNLVENSEYYLFDPRYVLIIGSIKSWYTILFADLKDAIGYMNYGDRVYKVYFNSSTILLIRNQILKYIDKQSDKKVRARGK